MASAVRDDKPTDENIKNKTVRVIDADGVGHPIQLSTILANINRKTTLVELVSDTKEQGTLVKIVDKLERARRLREAKLKAKAARKPTAKEMQLTWATDGHDLEHKLGKARKDLQRGARVDIVLTAKSGQKEYSHKEKMQKLQSIADTLQDVSTEWKPREIRKHMAVLYLQSNGAQESAQDDDDD